MKRIPKYLRNQIEDAIEKAKNHNFNDWEISVKHWGSPSQHVSYYGKSLNDALDAIPSTYSHTSTEGVELIVLDIRAQKIDGHGDIVDSEVIFEKEFTK